METHGRLILLMDPWKILISQVIVFEREFLEQWSFMKILAIKTENYLERVSFRYLRQVWIFYSIWRERSLDPEARLLTILYRANNAKTTTYFSSTLSKPIIASNDEFHLFISMEYLYFSFFFFFLNTSYRGIYIESEYSASSALSNRKIASNSNKVHFFLSSSTMHFPNGSASTVRLVPIRSILNPLFFFSFFFFFSTPLITVLAQRLRIHPRSRYDRQRRRSWRLNTMRSTLRWLRYNCSYSGPFIKRREVCATESTSRIKGKTRFRFLINPGPCRRAPNIVIT